jgi:hypothetical protein
VVLALVVWASAAFSPALLDAKVLFAVDTAVPRSVQAFAWRVIETRCSYQSYERGQRSFWVYEARATRVDAGTVYSLKILSDIQWKKTEPPAVIEMTLVDDGRVRLTALTSTFIPCTPSPGLHER